ncbi:MAG: DUF2313 domain-containing protein [Sphingomonadales bacterium]|nr:MAG: DUF2313 domain-containing protein [Sphingomonadales bacterium]
MRDAAAYRAMLAQLLPRGSAWASGPDTNLGKLLAGEAEEFARADARAQRLLDEADPRTALELLPDWERVAGLPDACTGAPDSLGERQAALANKIAQRGGQSRAFFIELAARLGYYIEISEFTSLDAGFSAGDACNDDGWRFAWLIEVLIGDDAYRAGYAEFCAGSMAGERLLGFGALDLECLIGRAKPAHTHAIFAYTVEPDPDFWFDFNLDEGN